MNSDLRNDSARLLLRGFPLGALFVLTAVCAVVASHLLPIYEAVRGGKIPPRDVLLTGILGGAVLMVVGGFLGLLQSRPWRGLVLGMLTGGFVGTILLPAALLPASALADYWLVSGLGALLITITGIIFRAR